jgi:hypothetical protein
MLKRVSLFFILVIAISVPLTSCSAISARVRPTPRPTPAPKAGAKTVQVKPSKLEEEVKSLTNRFAFGTFEWQLLELPAGSTWDETFAYYNTQMQQAGWSGDGAKSTNPEGHNVGAWVESDTKTGLVVVYISSTGGGPVNVIVISGQGPQETGG